MKNSIKVITIDSDESARNKIKAMFEKLPRMEIVGAAADLTIGMELINKHDPDVIFLDLYPAEEPVLKFAERLTLKKPEITIFVTSYETDRTTIIKSMRAGAREFISKPFNDQDILNAAKTIIRMQQTKSMESGKGGKVITVFGVKGGVGTTTIACNISVNLSQYSSKSVVLMDLNLQVGNAALFLNLKPKYSIIDVAKNLDNIDPLILKNSLPKHKSNVYLIPVPHKIEEIEEITSDQIEHIIAILRSIFDYVVIDSGSGFNDYNIVSMDDADKLVTVLTAEIPSVFNAKRCLDIFRKMDYSSEKIKIVVNRYDSNSPIFIDEIEKAINADIYWTIPNQDYVTAVSSINQGIPLSTKKPNSKASTSLKKLALSMNGVGSMKENLTKKSGFNRILQMFSMK